MTNDLPGLERRGIRKRSDEVIRRIKQAFLAEIKAEKSIEREEARSGELSQAALKILILAAVKIGLYLMLIYEELGLHSSAGKSAIDELLARGFILLHALARREAAKSLRSTESIDLNEC